ncbi:protein kinase STUNTED [Nymphaea colorata]|nr:protein kinase STUNTED [Nymphaea colorata]
MTKMGNLEKNGVDGGAEKTVLVGVNLDSQSKELLTWALVKVAQPGDRVIALHVLKNPGEVHTRDKSSVVCLVNTFDSVLSVYEGFCNLKQVDLKVKISRGPSVRKTLAQEAKTFGASTVIVGASKNSTLGSSVSIARYCARQLPKSCSILAVSNGKVMFQREASALNRQGVLDESRRTKIFGVLQRTLSKSSKVLSNSSDDASTNEDSGTCSESGDSPQFRTRMSTGTRDSPSVNSYDEGGLVFTDAFKLNTPKDTCQVCKIEAEGRGKDKAVNNKEKADSLGRKPCISSDCPTTDAKKEWALVPVQKLGAASNPIPLLMNEMSELKPGWPLLRRKFLPNRGDPNSTSQISVVQWAMQLPSRYSAAITSDYKSKKKNTSAPAFGNACNSNRRRELVPTDCIDDRKPQKEYENLPKELKTLYHRHASACRLFSYEVLARATSQFSSDNLVGKGGSSRVYKGCLCDGRELAVKILKSSNDAWKEFLLEIEMATTLKHKNIISLVGFCFTKSSFLLVYDFLSRGSLEENLHGSKDKHFLSWAERYKVAVGVARALVYLHNANSPPVVHRDVKSSNILLSDSFEAQLSDFGLAKWVPVSSHITCNDVAGTFGYLAPEYFMHGKVNDKIDVYSFGVVLLELLSGRKPISNESPKGRESLVMWAMPLLQKGEFDKVLDPTLGKNYDASQMTRMMLAALTCLRRAPRFRPRMDVVLKLLQGDEDVAKWAKFQICIDSEELDGLEDEAFPAPNIQSYLDLALLDVEEDSLSTSSMRKSIAQITKDKCLEDYLRRRGTLASSFG